MIREELEKRRAELAADLKYSYPDNFQRYKKDALDFAFATPGMSSFAELGCVWGIHCAYGLYVLDKYDLSRGVFVDTHWKEPARQACSERTAAEIVVGNFGDLDRIPKDVGNVDAVILFDVLLHQVAPDWRSVLTAYAAYTHCFVIAQPQYIAGPISLRLLDLGPERYFEHVPHSPDQEPYVGLFDKLYTKHPDHDRVWRDVHHIWQWAMTDGDLIAVMEHLGFRLTYYYNDGCFLDLEPFEKHAMVFQRTAGSVSPRSG